MLTQPPILLLRYDGERPAPETRPRCLVLEAINNPRLSQSQGLWQSSSYHIGTTLVLIPHAVLYTNRGFSLVWCSVPFCFHSPSHSGLGSAPPIFKSRGLPPLPTLGALHNCQQLYASQFLSSVYSCSLQGDIRGHTSPPFMLLRAPLRLSDSIPALAPGGPIAAWPPWRIIAHPRIL